MNPNAELRTPLASRWLFRATPIGLVLCAVALAYWPVLRCGFVDFDDDVYVTDNPQVQSGLTWPGIKWAFTNFSAGFWHPLTWLSHMLDCQIFGSEAWGHHLTNLVLHLANTALLFIALRQMTGKPWRCAIVAGLFGLHPLHVESVAWIAERKDVLSTFFFMLTLIAYVKYVTSGVCRGSRTPSSSSSSSFSSSTLTSTSDASAHPLVHSPTWASRIPHASIWYCAALLLFAFGLMAKPMVVTLPFVLLLLDYWPLSRVQNPKAGVQSSKFKVQSSKAVVSGQWSVVRGLILEKVPFLALAGAFTILTYLAERRVGALALEAGPPLHLRVVNAVVSYATYLEKTIWPGNLAAFYPYPSSFSAWQIVQAAFVLLAVSAGALALRRSVPSLLMGWCWYGLTLLPVIGLIQVGSHAMADRYTYLPLIGIFIAAVFTVPDFSFWLGSSGRRAWGTVVTVVLLAVCGLLTFQQLQHWRDSEALFLHDLEVVGNNVPALTGLGAVFLEQGKPDLAARQFIEALRLDARHAPAGNDLGMALLMQGKTIEAKAQFKQVLLMHPENAEAHNNLGKCLAEQGELTNAIVEFSEAVRLRPNYQQAQYNLAKAQHEAAHQ
ncbi:MAG: hypothetical protein C5B50_23205 [Verrucomicrobia bacterium]|nr:MAG: hypothetical protein C5B50_23205 [Verrucomicrobiota bacterium]